MSALSALWRKLPEIVGWQFFDCDPTIAPRPPMGFGTDTGEHPDRSRNANRTVNRTTHGGTGLAMARVPRHEKGRRVHTPRALDHHQDITWLVGESDAQRVADMIDKLTVPRHGRPHASAVRAGAPGEAASSTGDVRQSPAVTRGALPAFETWRRRIAEESVHQEGVSL